MPDLNATTLEAAMKVVHGTAKNMGTAIPWQGSQFTFRLPDLLRCCAGVLIQG